MIPGTTRGIRMLHAITIVSWAARARYTSRPFTGHAGFPGGISFATFPGMNRLSASYPMGPSWRINSPIIGISDPLVKAAARTPPGKGMINCSRDTGDPMPTDTHRTNPAPRPRRAAAASP
jgi:hypothetical protein